MLSPSSHFAVGLLFLEFGTREPQLWGRGVLLMVLLRVNGIGIEFTLTKTCPNTCLKENGSSRVLYIVRASLLHEWLPFSKPLNFLEYSSCFK